MNDDSFKNLTIARHGNLEIALYPLDRGVKLRITTNVLLELPVSDLEPLEEIL